MGSFYTNITLKSPDQSAVAQALTAWDRRAFVSPAFAGKVVVYDAQCDEQDTTTLVQVAQSLVERFACPALAVLNHDDDLLWYTLLCPGQPSDEYVSTPDCFDPSAGHSPDGGDPERLCAAFERAASVAEVGVILRKPQGDGYCFATERHEALVAALQLPKVAVGFGYNYLSEGEFPEECTEEDFVET